MADQEQRLEVLLRLFEHTQVISERYAVRAVNSALVVRNWLCGLYIVEFENGGASRSELYGAKLIGNLSKSLSERMGRGWSKRTLELYRQFYLTYAEIAQTISAQSFASLSDCINVETINKLSDLVSNEIAQTASAQSYLSWSHYVCLMSLKNEQERKFYEIEARKGGWALRELKRQVSSSLFERLALSRDKEGVLRLASEGQVLNTPKDIIKDPYVLEFLNLEERGKYTESDLETAIINKLEFFLLELGKGFLFDARQKRFTFDEDHFYVDLVFYNRLLKCYTLIDLKIGTLTHQDLGQMQMYVNYYDRYVKTAEENPTIGIIICKRNKESLVEITLPNNANIHASEYQLYLPSKEELSKQLVEAERDWERNHEQ